MDSNQGTTLVVPPASDFVVRTCLIPGKNPGGLLQGEHSNPAKAPDSGGTKFANRTRLQLALRCRRDPPQHFAHDLPPAVLIEHNSVVLVVLRLQNIKGLIVAQPGNA